MKCELLFKVEYFNWLDGLRRLEYIKVTLDCQETGLDPSFIADHQSSLFNRVEQKKYDYDNQPNRGEFEVPSPRVTFIQYCYC